MPYLVATAHALHIQHHLHRAQQGAAQVSDNQQEDKHLEARQRVAVHGHGGPVPRGQHTGSKVINADGRHIPYIWLKHGFYAGKIEAC